MSERHPFAKPGHERVVRSLRRFEFACPPRQCLQIRTQQRFEQGFPRREMAKQGGQPYVGPAGDVPHGRIGSVLGDHVARDRQEMAVILSGIGSHRSP